MIKMKKQQRGPCEQCGSKDKKTESYEFRISKQEAIFQDVGALRPEKTIKTTWLVSYYRVLCEKCLKEVEDILFPISAALKAKKEVVLCPNASVAGK